MSNESWVPPAPVRKSGSAKIVLRAVLGLFVAGVGFAFGYLGCRVIGAREFALNWTSSRSSSISVTGIRAGTSESLKQTAHWTGGEAVLLGAGFIAFGAMFTVWGIAVGRPPRHSEGGYKIVLTIMSLTFLSSTLVLTFPPWTWRPDSGATGLYGAILAIGIFIWPRVKFPARARDLRRLFALLVFGAIAGTFLLPITSSLMFGMVMGVFSSVFIGVHLAILNPRWQDILQAESPAGDPPPRD